MTEILHAVRNVDEEVEEETIEISSEGEGSPQRTAGPSKWYEGSQACCTFLSGVLSFGCFMFIIVAVKSTTDEGKAMSAVAAAFCGAFSMLCIFLGVHFNNKDIFSKCRGEGRHHSSGRLSSRRVTYSRRGTRSSAEESQMAGSEISQTGEEQSSEAVSEQQRENYGPESIVSEGIPGPSVSTTGASRKEPETASAGEQRSSLISQNKEQQNIADASSGSEYEELSNGEIRRRRKVITNQKDLPRSSPKEDPVKE